MTFKGYSPEILDELARNWDETIRAWDKTVYALGVRHRHSIGWYREQLIAEMLRSFLPSAFEVSSGFAVGGNSGEKPHASTQLDLIVWNRVEFGAYLRERDLAIVPVEAVNVVLEVKTSLDRTNLIQACRACCLLKQLCPDDNPRHLRFVVMAFEMKSTFEILIQEMEAWLRTNELPASKEGSKSKPMALKDSRFLPDLVLCGRRKEEDVRRVIVSGADYLKYFDGASLALLQQSSMTSHTPRLWTRMMLRLVAEATYPNEQLRQCNLAFALQLKELCDALKLVK